jgi:hypothetical protein
MRCNQILAITFCSLACLGYPNRSANSGWFGPANYDECMLEKMKGQGYYMAEIAKETCRLKFQPKPAPKPKEEEVLLNERFIHFNWCAWEKTSKQICMVDKPDNYTITKVTVDFSAKSPCERIPPPDFSVPLSDQYEWQYRRFYEDLNNWITITGEKAYFSPTYTFKTPPGNLNCVDVHFFGFIK